MNFDMSKYTFVEHISKTGSKQITAISSYAGKTVKGVAKCDPSDEYVVGDGMTLAAARCNEKVAKKRVARAKACLEEAEAYLAKAQRLVNDMKDYYTDAVDKLAEAENEIHDILEEFGN
jgi:hypothetical protein